MLTISFTPRSAHHGAQLGQPMDDIHDYQHARHRSLWVVHVHTDTHCSLGRAPARKHAHIGSRHDSVPGVVSSVHTSTGDDGTTHGKTSGTSSGGVTTVVLTTAPVAVLAAVSAASPLAGPTRTHSKRNRQQRVTGHEHG